MWDVFHSERLEVLRRLSLEEIRAGLAAGSLREDDLVRPAGSAAPWSRLTELPGLAAPPATPPSGPAPEPGSVIEPPVSPAPAPVAAPPPTDDANALPGSIVEDASDSLGALLGDEESAGPTPPGALLAGALASDELPTIEAELVLPVEDTDAGPFDPQDGDEEAAEFTLAPAAGRPVEPVDLTAMVDVSFLLILFFLITATAVYLKTLEVPEPNPERNEAAAPQPRTIEDLESDFILVEIDPQGTVRVDHEPVEATLSALADRLRQARSDSGRTGMLLTADPATLHRYAVLAYDAANEVGLRIAIARPSAARPAAGAGPP